MKISTLCRGAALAALAAAAGAGVAQAQTTDVSSDIATLKAQVAALQASQKKDDSSWSNTTKISGRMYFNFSNVDHTSDGVKQADNGTSFDIKRLYIGIDHKFDDIWSANVTTDFQYDAGAGATQLYIKKAYLEANISPALRIRAGSADMPWIPFVEDIYGLRQYEQTLIDRTKFGTSADWGVHASGKIANFLDYAVAVVDGAGYKHPFRSNSVDVEARISAKVKDFTFAIGGYDGKLGKNVEGSATPDLHTASRFDALAAYTNDKIRVGLEYFHADNWNNVTTVASDSSDGYSLFGSYKFLPKWTAFSKYENVNPRNDTASSFEEKYYNLGISYSPTKIVDLGLVYKHDNAKNGVLATGNGNIGGLTKGDYDEIGIFGQLRY
jgi:hypothetical protein